MAGSSSMMSKRDFRCIVPPQCTRQLGYIIVLRRDSSHCKSPVKNCALFLHTGVYNPVPLRRYTLGSVCVQQPHGGTTMKYLVIRIAQILRSPRGALGLFAGLVLGTAALMLAPKAAGGGGGPVAGHAGGPTVVSNHDTNGVTFSGTLAQTKLVQGGNGILYLDLTIVTPPAALASSDTKASDVVVVLDRSGSMAADNRLPYAKEAVRSLVSRLHGDDRFALITFDSVAVVNTALTPVTDAVRAQILRRLEAIQPGASTNISDGLLKARALLQGDTGGRSRKVILLS